MTILGISIGTKRTGVCIIHYGKLMERSIHSYQAAWSEHKLRIILNRYKRYIVKRKVTDIIVKIPPLKRHTKAIAQVIQGIEQLAKKHGCNFDLITKNEIKYRTNLRNTNSLIEYVRLEYPELTTLYTKNIANDHLYHKKLYESVLAAHIYQGMQLARAMQKANTEE